ncbi:hypothetical protein [Bacillus wiedmannii]|uniref:hypothetical protein n=2 Tax=Bacillus TaxID=1386 RepID=UPI0011A1752D|nr:hypothetical protein [Bacillus wiedmannii]
MNNYKGYKDVYLLEGQTIDGNYSQAATIDTVTEEQARELIKAGKAKDFRLVFVSHINTG